MLRFISSFLFILALFSCRSTEFVDGDYFFLTKWDYSFLKKKLEFQFSYFEEENNKGDTPLLLAIRENDIQVVQYLVTNGVDFKRKNSQGIDAIQLAMLYGHKAILQYLLEYALLRYPESKISYFFFVTYKGNVDEFVKFVNNDKKFVNLDVLQEAIRLASANNQLAIVKYFFEVLKLDDKDDIWGNSLLDYAVIHNAQDVLFYLINDIGQDINHVNNNNETVLFSAIRRYNLPIINFLLQSMIDVDIRNNQGTTALLLSALYNDLGIVKVLLQYGADLDAVDNQKNTIFHYALKYYPSESASLAHIFTQKGSIINVHLVKYLIQVKFSRIQGITE